MKKLGTSALAALMIMGTWPSAGSCQTVLNKNPLPVRIEVSSVGNLLPYGNDELGNRMPLILVHGIGAEDEKLYHWGRFLKHADKNPEFQKRFKVYLYRYDSNESVPKISLAFQQTLKDFINAHEQRQFRVLAYSEGGLLYRNVMQDPQISAHTDKVITVGTPFHGSPLASPAWFKKQLRKTFILSPVRATQKISYWIAGKKYPSFQADFQWDNFDRAISAEEFALAKGKGELKGYAAESNSKFITYGSYFGVGIDPEQNLPRELGVKQPLPKERPRLRNLFSPHFLFALIRNNISGMPICTTAIVEDDSANNAPEPKGVFKTSPKAMMVKTEEAAIKPLLKPLMVYNDGISPISSTLWLGRFAPAEKVSDPKTTLWSCLKSLRGSHRARLFSSLDHRDWMDGSTRSNTDEVKDLLHPEEPSKTVFEWFIHDLLDS